MRSPAVPQILVAVGLLCLSGTLACRPQGRAPAWVKAAPAEAMVSVSGEAGWMLTQKDFQSLVAKEPLVERALDLFLQKAHINPRTETGRVTFHVIGVPQQVGADLKGGLEHTVIQLNQFNDPKSLISALTESFPQEGSLHLQGRDWPLYVILDVEAKGVKAHIRAASDEQGQVWIGSLEVLQRMATRASLATLPDAALAADWLSPKAPFQGFLQPETLLAGLRKNLDGTLLKDLPQGVTALFWSVTPAAEKDQPVKFELALAGTPEGINQVTPWLQRLVAATSAVQSSPGAAPELLQEKRRVGLRCSLTAEQLKLVMEKLGQSGLPAAFAGTRPKA